MNISGKLLFAAIALLFVVPFSYNVTIVKEDITSNRAFAGVLGINGEDYTIGSHLCCEYWLRKDEQPNRAVFTITTTPAAWVVGMTHVQEKGVDVSSEDAYFKSLGY